MKQNKTKPRKRNIRTSSWENRVEYLLENRQLQDLPAWRVEEIKRAMRAAYDAGRRDEKENRVCR